MDKLILNSVGNDVLSNYLSTKQPGEKCKMTVEGVFTGDDKGEATFRVTSVKLPGRKQQDTPSRVQDSDYKASPVSALYDEE